MAANITEGVSSVSRPIAGTDKSLHFETGLLAPQSQGAVVASIGETTVLATANAASGVREGIDFFPLTVDVEERMYAAGKIPGSFFRREGRPADTAILTARLIDRPLRPSFADGYRNETQVVVTVLGADLENPHDVLAINAASAALMLSGIPFEGPIGAVRIAWNADGEWVPHPTYQEGDSSAFELVVAGRQLDDGDIAIMMVEAGGTSAAWEMFEGGAPKVTEAVIADGLESAKAHIRDSIELQRELVSAAGARPPLSYEPQVDYGDDIAARVAEVGTARVDAVTTITARSEREAAQSEVAASIVAELASEFEGREGEIKAAVRSLTKKLVRARIASTGVRMDGRGATDIRAVSAAVGVVSTAHGSGLFQRGETQVLNITTLGMPRMDQLLDTIGVDEKKRYMHHYNMPPYANGETGRVGSPKRREIGHGLLAERALLPVIPPVEEFPYALRLVSEVLSSNGSTSMGSVCASTLSLMDAGVPIKAPVAGIAMGLVKVDDRYITLTDILGAEDAFGDMDFKVAGTSEFVTALQLDTKIDGLPADVLGAALRQAYEARMQILAVMEKAIAEPRHDVRDTAPKIVSLEIPIDKIGEVIGPKGKVINALQQETGTDIAVDDDGLVGTVTIGAKDGGAVAEARRRIEMILDPPKAEVGATYTGKVVNITKFGAFVNILPGRDGLVHISKLGRGKRVERVEDVVDLGDEIEVRVDDIDPQGKVSLSLIGDGPEAKESAGSSSGSGSGSALALARARVRGRRPAIRPPFRSKPAGRRRRRPPSVTSARPATVTSGRAEIGVTGRRGETRAGAGPDSLTHRSTTLDGGLTVVTEHMADARSASIGFWVGTGSVDEPAPHAGASHFLEHLLFKGTADRTARSIAMQVDSVGGDMNAYTTKEYTTFYLRLLAEDADMGVQLLSDIVWSPAFRADEFESERQVILEEILMHGDEPAELVHDFLASTLWPDHPLGREVLGSAASISAMNSSDVAEFHGAHYRAGNLVVAAAGAVDHDRICSLVSDALARQGRTGGAAPVRSAPAPARGGRTDWARDTEQAHLAVAVPGPDREDEQRHALAIVEHVLGGGMSSRLFQSIREERGLAYSVYSFRLGFEGAGALGVYAGTSPDQAETVLALIEEEMDRVASDGVTEAELESARGHMRGSMALGLEDSGARMGRIGHAQLVHGRVLTIDEVEERLAGMTLESVNEAARRWLSQERTVVTVGPGPEPE